MALAETIRYSIHFHMVNMWVWDKVPEYMGVKYTHQHRPTIWDLLRVSGSLCNMEDKLVCSFGRKYQRETLNLSAVDKTFIIQLQFIGGFMVGMAMMPFSE
jgi:uncharacterized protein (UPF0261 family)